EFELRSHGRVHLWRSESGGDTGTLSQVLAFIDAERLLAQTVVLTTIESPLTDSPLAGLNVELGTARGWQDEVRKQLGRVLKFYDPSGVKAPKRGESWIEQRLLELSVEPYPTANDIQLVTRVAAAFSISHAVRSRIASNPLLRNGFAWRLSAQGPHLRRPSTAPVLGAEILLHFAVPEWIRGLAKPKTVVIRPFNLGNSAGTVPLYRVSDFKGLEAEVVVLVMRGRLPNQREATYVGISRARALLFIVADPTAASTLPRAFVWD
ncbi:MAG TPA: hypothetical protein VHP33_23355, partial [Polyangiaceae bacterium]|nr:hypothetical protein [Polyangiaceae bacterium]